MHLHTVRHRPLAWRVAPRLAAQQQQQRSFLVAQRRQIALTEEVPLPREAIFAAVADVARYSEFLPFCSTSQILRRHSATSFEARLSIGFLAFTEDYVSHVQLTPPESIVAEASDTPLFSHLQTVWRFEPGGAGAGSTRLHFLLDMRLRSAIHDQALRPVLDRVASEQVAAFRKRCEALHAAGEATPAAGGDAGGHEGAASASADLQSPPRAPVLPGSAPAGASADAMAPEPPASAAQQQQQRLRLQVEPAWRQRVDAAFDAHALNGNRLTLPRFVEACRALGVGTDVGGTLAADPPPSEPPSELASELLGGFGSLSVLSASSPSELRQGLLASWFVQFDEDASGGVDRCEFVRNLWILSRASDAERRAFAFARLDINGSGALERDDLARSLRRQLGLSRRLVPVLVRQRMRREATSNLVSATRETGPGGEQPSAHAGGGAQPLGTGGGGAGGGAGRESSRERSARLRTEAEAVACAALDELDEQVDALVADVFASFGAADRIDYAMWCRAWSGARLGHGTDAATSAAGRLHERLHAVTLAMGGAHAATPQPRGSEGATGGSSSTSTSRE